MKSHDECAADGSYTPDTPGNVVKARIAAAGEIERLRKLESVVKAVLGQQADDVCWRDVYTEMAGLVGVEFKPILLPKDQFLRNCAHFADCLASGEHYMSIDIDDRPLEAGDIVQVIPGESRSMWLGSTLVVTDANPGVVKAEAAVPYGKERMGRLIVPGRFHPSEIRRIGRMCP